jgi:hypothetical protein
MTQNFLNLLRYKNTFGDHNMEIFAAHESNSYQQKISYASKQKAVLYDTYDLDQYIIVSSPPGSFTNTSALESYFGQFNYNYGGKYYFTASARRDGSSRFKNEKWGTFGSIGASWVISKESFMDIKSINYLKLKTSYGLLGDQEGVGLWPGYDTFDVGNLNDDYAISIRDNGNADLTWEKSKIFQVGVESSLFDFLDVNVDYYVKNTYDLIFQRRTAPSTGVAIVTVNDGELKNQGIEFDVNAHIFKGKTDEDFSLDFAINGELLKNEITTMPLDPATGLPKVLDTSNAPFAWAEGRSVYDFYMPEWAGVDPATGVPMWYMNYNDINDNGTFDTGDVIIRSLTDYLSLNPTAIVGKTVTTTYADATQKFIGKSAIPKVRGAFRLNASYKNFELTTQFTYSMGGYAYDGAYAGLMANGSLGQNNWHTDVRNRWQQPGDITGVPRLSAALDANVNARSTRFLTKADYFGLNNVQLGYNLPGKFADKLNLSKLNIFVSGDNLLFFSQRDGFNTSTSESGGSDTYRYSPLSTFSLGLKVEF